MSTQNKNPGVSQDQWFDPFPEPHTFPSGWDLSELCPEPQPAPVNQEELSSDSLINRGLEMRISRKPEER
jgi:hypothetical protein